MSEQAPQKAQNEDLQHAAELAAVLAVLQSGPPLVTAVRAISAALKTPAKFSLALLHITGYKPGKKGSILGSDPVAMTRRANLRYRAAYIIAALVRLSTADDLKAALAREKTLFAAHREACARRLAAAKNTAQLTEQHGPVLGWSGVLDGNTTPDCRYLIGKNFKAANPPDGLFPGGRHPRCRCFPVAPFTGKPVVTSLPAGM
jgi:hypothetical protein